MIEHDHRKRSRGPWRICLLSTLFFFFALSGTPAFPQDSASSAVIPSAVIPDQASREAEFSRVNAALEAAQGELTPDPEQIKLLQSVLLDLSELRAARTRIDQFERDIAAAGDRREKLKDQLAEVPDEDSKPKIPEDLDEVSLREGLDVAQEKWREVDLKIRRVEEELARRETRRVEMRADSIRITGKLTLLETDEIQDSEPSQTRLIEKYRVQLGAIERERKYYEETADILRLEQRLWIRNRDADNVVLKAWQKRVADDAVEAAEASRKKASTVADSQESELARAKASIPHSSLFARRRASGGSSEISSMCQLGQLPYHGSPRNSGSSRPAVVRSIRHNPTLALSVIFETRPPNALASNCAPKQTPRTGRWAAHAALSKAISCAIHGRPSSVAESELPIEMMPSIPSRSLGSGSPAARRMVRHRRP